MTIQRKLAAFEKRIKDLPCKAHHIVWPHEQRAKKYDDGTPWVLCTCGGPVIVMDYGEPETESSGQFNL